MISILSFINTKNNRPSYIHDDIKILETLLVGDTEFHYQFVFTNCYLIQVFMKTCVAHYTGGSWAPRVQIPDVDSSKITSEPCGLPS